MHYTDVFKNGHPQSKQHMNNILSKTPTAFLPGAWKYVNKTQDREKVNLSFKEYSGKRMELRLILVKRKCTIF